MSKDARMAALLASMTDPVTRAIVIHLTLEPATAAQLAAELEVSAEKVRYHLKRLRRAKLVKVQASRQHRGAVEHVYIADSRQLILDGREMTVYLGPTPSRFNHQTLQSIFEEVLAATRMGSFYEREDFAIVRIPMEVDSRGVEEVNDLMEASLTRLVELREKCLSRLERSCGPSRQGTAAFLFFEAPEE